MTDELSQLIQQMDVPPTGGRSSNNRTMQQTNGKYILPQSRQESSAACPLFCPLLGRTSLSASTVHIYCWKSFTYRKPPRFCAQHSFSATSVNIKPGLLGTPFGGTGVSAVLLAGETVRFSAVSTPPLTATCRRGALRWPEATGGKNNHRASSGHIRHWPSGLPGGGHGEKPPPPCYSLGFRALAFNRLK